MKNRWNSRIKVREKNSNEKDQIEKFSQKEVGKDNIKEYLWDMADTNRCSRKRGENSRGENIKKKKKDKILIL